MTFYFNKLNELTFNKSAEGKQDRFAYGIGGPNGTYIEIGACGPSQRSNTVALERYGWQGFGIELDEAKHRPGWEASDRKNKVYWDNALTFDYQAAVTACGLPQRINFLQVDIEPPEFTFQALQRVVEQGLVFDCITFEHDDYAWDTCYHDIATEYLKTHGYKIAVYNVCSQRKRNPGVWSHMETWYVKDDVPFDTIEFFDWKEKYNIK